MKITEIVDKYSIDKTEFLRFLYDNNHPPKSTFLGELYMDDADVQKYMPQFNKYAKELHEAQDKLLQQQKKDAEEEACRKILDAEEDIRKKKAMSQMLITSGFNFDGYHIVKYSGYISGDDAISVNRGLAIFGDGTNVKDKLMESLVVIRRNALRELKEAAYDLGCNAVIGVDFDYLTLDPQTANITGGTTYQPYVFGVTANGNAVIIEKDEN